MGKKKRNKLISKEARTPLSNQEPLTLYSRMRNDLDAFIFFCIFIASKIYFLIHFLLIRRYFLPPNIIFTVLDVLFVFLYVFFLSGLYSKQKEWAMRYLVPILFFAVIIGLKIYFLRKLLLITTYSLTPILISSLLDYLLVFLFVILLLPPKQKEWVRDYLVPLQFFGVIIGTKIYYLINSFVIRGNFFILLNLLDQANKGGGISQALINTSAELAYNLVAILFDALIISTYVIRSKPVGKAEGFWERYYPLITILFPMIGFTLLLMPDFRILFPQFQIGRLGMIFDLPLLFPMYIVLAGLIISLIGAALSIVALWSLKKRFSLMVEVRKLVTTGMYRHIRHPLYMSEIIHAFGTSILAAHPIAFSIFCITLVLEIIRAKLEEHKFLRLVPAYADFKKRTGFLWPKFW
jgi:protein-S-isoprenylcysteine O-methyltransferase Ste14